MIEEGMRFLTKKDINGVGSGSSIGKCKCVLGDEWKTDKDTCGTFCCRPLPVMFVDVLSSKNKLSDYKVAECGNKYIFDGIEYSCMGK